MTTKVFCDRCDQRCDGEDTCGWRVRVYEEKLYPPKDERIDLDLCKHCVTKLRTFLKLDPGD